MCGMVPFSFIYWNILKVYFFVFVLSAKEKSWNTKKNRLTLWLSANRKILLRLIDFLMGGRRWWLDDGLVYWNVLFITFLYDGIYYKRKKEIMGWVTHRPTSVWFKILHVPLKKYFTCVCIISVVGGGVYGEVWEVVSIILISPHYARPNFHYE